MKNELLSYELKDNNVKEKIRNNDEDFNKNITQVEEEDDTAWSKKFLKAANFICDKINNSTGVYNDLLKSPNVDILNNETKTMEVIESDKKPQKIGLPRSKSLTRVFNNFRLPRNNMMSGKAHTCIHITIYTI